MVPRKTQDRILLVDDLALVRRTVPARLGSLGREVSSVANVSEASEWLEKHEAAMILLDVVLPGRDGFSFCRELKADPRYARIPVIMLTDVGGNILDRSLEAGADDYLPKRIDDAFLRIRVRLHLHLFDLRREQDYAPTPEGPAVILLATQSSLLQAQIPAQLAQDGHDVRLADRLDEVVPASTGSEKLLILDMALDPEGTHDFLAQLRMDPATSDLPVLLLCDKNEVDGLAGLEFMLDDVLVKPLTAQLIRQRMQLLLEMGKRVRGS